MDNEIENFEIEEGKNIEDIIESYATIENAFKRIPEEGEFEDDSISWVFTQKGERLYRRLLLSAKERGALLFPNQKLNIEKYTGVKYN